MLEVRVQDCRLAWEGNMKKLTLGDKLLLMVLADWFWKSLLKLAMIVMIIQIIIWAIPGCSSDGIVDGDSATQVNASGNDGNASDGHSVGDQGTDLGQTIKPDSNSSEIPMNCPNGAGCKCKSNDDCDIGYCIQHRSGKFCATECVTSCPNGFDCSESSSSDSLWFCKPRDVQLCNPCKDHTDCGDSKQGNRCIPRADGSGSYCGMNCELNNGFCPSGYECKQYTQSDGIKSMQCQRLDDAICECSLLAASDKLETTCAYNSCNGTRKCTANGLTECMPPTDLSKEVCDGKDNDCDGKVDAEQSKTLCDDGDQCTSDECSKKTSECVYTQILAESKTKCDDGDVCTEKDTCASGKCVGGQVTNCDDDNPCTIDKCDPVKGCIHPGDSIGFCKDDGEVCTDDKCQDGLCVHSGNSKPCNDNNKCTLGDFCDSTSATCTKSKGTPDCNDNNACTIDSCVPEKACVHKPGNDGSKCSSDSGSLYVCQNGQCVTKG